MNKTIGYFFFPIMASGLVVNKGLANLSVFILITLYLFFAISMSAVFFGKVDSLKANFTKKVSKKRKIFKRVMMTVYILTAAYQGYFIAGFVLVILCVYVFLIREAIRNEETSNSELGTGEAKSQI